MHSELNGRLIKILLTRFVSVLKIHLQDQNKDKLLDYKGAIELTTLSEDILRGNIKSGRFVEGRHYIMEGTRVLFAPDLPTLMFEDKLSPRTNKQETGTHHHRKIVDKTPVSPSKKLAIFGSVNPANMDYKGRA